MPGPTRGRFPPRQVAEAVVAGVLGRRRPPRWSEPTWWTVTAASHFAFGAAAGAAYPHLVPAVGPVPARGAAFGLAVGAATYLVLFPLLGIDAPQADRPVRKAAELVAAHLAWGVTTALLHARLTSPPASAATPAGSASSAGRAGSASPGG